MDDQLSGVEGAARHDVPIFIDGKQIEAPHETMTGEQIRDLTSPPISEDRDLWLDREGKLDELIADTEPVHVRRDMRFFTVPRVINPGGIHAARG